MYKPETITGHVFPTSTQCRDGRVDNSLPLNLLIDASGDLWGLGEFNQHFYHLPCAATAKTEELQNILFPRIIPKPFLLPLRGKISPSFSSQFGEKVLLTCGEKGRVVWFSRGGAYCIPYYGSDDYAPVEEWGNDVNYSEIVAWYPDQPVPFFEVYRLPKGWANVSGMHWDQQRQSVWFLEFSHDKNEPHISLLRPFDHRFHPGSNTPLMHPIKPDAWQHFAIPECFHSVAHLTEDDSGWLWFTGFLSNNIGCFDPVEERFYCLQLPRAISGHHKGKGPWDIHHLKNNNNEYLLVSEFYDAAIGILDLTAIKRYFRQNPDADDFPENEMTSVFVERFFADPIVEGVNEVHTLCFDAQGRLWFTTSNIEKNISTGIIGVIELGCDEIFSNWQQLPLQLFSIESENQEKTQKADEVSAFTGIACTGEGEGICVFVADQFARQLIRCFPFKG